MSHSVLIGTIYLNETLDDILKRISSRDPAISKEIYLRLNGLDALSLEKCDNAISKEKLSSIRAAEAMEFFCDDDIGWIKKECSEFTSYHISGFSGDTHPKNHHVEILRDKKNHLGKWLISIHYGEIGEDVITREYIGNSSKAKKEAISMVKNLLKNGHSIVV